MMNQKKIKKGVKRPSIWERIPIIQVWRDLYNYRNWVKIISAERENPKSKFRKYNMEHSYFYVVYLSISLPEEDNLLPDNIKKLRLIEMLAPVHQYLDDDLGFAGYIVPEFNQFYDEDDKPTLTYVAIYRFAFNKLSFKWVLSRLIGISLAIWALFQFVLV
jgi:hypothetical protein